MMIGAVMDTNSINTINFSITQRRYARVAFLAKTLTSSKICQDDSPTSLAHWFLP
jgi:hypothetical protein